MEQIPRLVGQRFERCARAAAGAAAIAGGAVLAGRALHVEMLKSIPPGLATMKPITALSLVLVGVALWMVARDSPKLLARRWAACLAGLAALVGLLTLIEYIGGRDLLIDQLLFREEPGGTRTPWTGRMSPATAVTILLVGTSIAALAAKGGGWLSQIAAFLGGLAALIATLGTIYGVKSPYGSALSTSMAVHTAAALTLMAAAALCAQPGRALMRTVTAEGAGGLLARRILPVALILPAVLGWLGVEGQKAGLYGTEFGTSLLVAALIVSLSAFVWGSAWSLDRADRKRRDAERATLQEQAHRAAVVETALDAIIVIDGEGRVVEFNPAAERIFGTRRADAIGHEMASLVIPPALRDAHRRGLKRFRESGEAPVLGKRLELTAVRADGSEFPVELAISRVPVEGPPMFAGQVRDISERKEAEQQIRRMNQELEQRVVERTAQLQAANRELEAFTYSVSHDLRAPLRGIDGFSQALLEDYSDRLDAQGRSCLERVRAASQRMGVLIDDLLSLSHLSRSELTQAEVRLSEIARQVAAELAAADPQRRVAFEIEEGLTARGDARLLRAALQNLMANAWKFTSTREAARIQFGSAPQPNGAVACFVRDDGAGFDMAYADKLFAPFQRLHGAGDFPGSGIGLATVQRIIHRHGGEVWAEGSLGVGATFYFSLPDGPTKPAQEQ